MPCLRSIISGQTPRHGMGRRQQPQGSTAAAAGAPANAVAVPQAGRPANIPEVLPLRYPFASAALAFPCAVMASGEG